MLTSDVLNRGTTFVVYALVARYLGVRAVGQMSLAITFFWAFQIFGAAGLKNVIIREVAKDRTKTDQYLINSSAIVAVTSLFSFIVLWVVVSVLNYPAATTSVILVMGLGLFPLSLSTIYESVFQAWERMHYITYAHIPVSVAKVGLTFLLLWQGYDLLGIITLLVTTRVAILGIEWWLLRRYIARPRLKLDLRFSVATLRTSATFLGIQGIITIKPVLFVVVLSKLAGETEVGLLAVASQLMQPLRPVFDNVVISVFPVMCRQFKTDLQSLRRITESLMEFVLTITLPTSVGLFFLSDALILLIYGDEDFLQAAPVLRITVWALILGAFISVLGRVLQASNRERITLRILIINTLIQLVVGLSLISLYGLIGAAIAGLVIPLVSFFQHYVPTARLLNGISLGRLIWKPIAATVCMALFLIVVNNQSLPLTIISAGILYVAGLVALTVWAVGGPRQLKARYLAYYGFSDVLGEEIR